jgi:hypothetical protein
MECPLWRLLISSRSMFGNGSKQNVHSLERTFHRCFLPSYSSFGWGFSEEKIKLWKVNGWQTTDTKWWQKLILPLARFAKKILKCPLGQMNRNLVGSIYGRSSMKIAHFVRSVNKHGYHRNLVGNILKCPPEQWWKCSLALIIVRSWCLVCRLWTVIRVRNSVLVSPTKCTNKRCMTCPSLIEGTSFTFKNGLTFTVMQDTGI